MQFLETTSISKLGIRRYANPVIEALVSGAIYEYVRVALEYILLYLGDIKYLQLLKNFLGRVSDFQKTS